MSDRARIKLFADGADIASMRRIRDSGTVSGFTTNPSLMRKAGVSNYASFAREVVREIPDMPVSFEVFADDFQAMESQAREIAGWGENIYVKVPVQNTKGEPAYDLIRTLSGDGLKLNVTAVFTLQQVDAIVDALDVDTPAVVSVFAGRIADTGQDPVPIMTAALERLASRPRAELLWASPREILNFYQADAIGCHIITMAPDQLEKLALRGKDHHEYSRETVEMFYKDALSAGYSIEASLVDR